jgi:predicted nucleic acid-binding protein
MSSGAELTVIDTSCWIEAMRERGDATVRRHVAALLESGAARFTDMVRLELCNGLAGADQRRFLRDLEDLVETVPTTAAVWAAARALAEKARAGGVTVPATDVLVFAAARAHGARLLHRDAHFDMLADLGAATDG